uniref:AAA ATPase, central domain protein n=1 Tax=Rhodopseudomonas palustris (strain BisA53) TaxID=316055 RepID=Q07PL8_RHOP5
MIEIEMKRSQQSRSPQRILRAPARTAGTLIARNIIIRALRRNGLSHVLRGRMATVGFLYPASLSPVWLSDAAIELLPEFTTKQHTHAMFEPQKGRERKEESLANQFVESHTFFGFAADLEHFPEAFRFVADDIVRLGPIDHRAIEVAARTIMGFTLPSEILQSAIHLPCGLLSAAFKPGRTLRDVVEILGRQTSSKPNSLATTKLKDLSGFGEAAEWGHALADDLADYKTGRIQWSDVDRGALISGPSGTGKTLFVQALGASCGVPVHAHSLARWQARGHLGQVLSAMRAAFEQAAEDAPCILFLDEFDAFGSRDQFAGDNEQYCREVVNGLLECLDGIERLTGVVVLGATNLPEKIDPALLRPGRLGRHLRIGLPDAVARSGILRHHLGSQLPKIDVSLIAANLEGTSGAVIEQIVRDARRRARNACRDLTIEDLTASLPARTRLSDASYRRACVHEAGHVLAGYLLRYESGALPVHVKVSREFNETRSAGRTVFQRVPGFDRPVMAYIAEIATLMAGLAAEIVLLDEYADGGGGSEESDLHRATIVAASVIASLGLGGSLVYLASAEGEHLLALLGSNENLRRRVDALLGECFDQVQAILSEHRKPLEVLAEAISVRNEMNAEELAEFIVSVVRRGTPAD